MAGMVYSSAQLPKKKTASGIGVKGGINHGKRCDKVSTPTTKFLAERNAERNF